MEARPFSLPSQRRPLRAGAAASELAAVALFLTNQMVESESVVMMRQG
jgi:hypothetical protein